MCNYVCRYVNKYLSLKAKGKDIKLVLNESLMTMTKDKDIPVYVA